VRVLAQAQRLSVLENQVSFNGILPNVQSSQLYGAEMAGVSVTL
jgi:hypothetical protein